MAVQLPLATPHTKLSAGSSTPRQHNWPDQLRHTLDVGDLGGERWGHWCLLLWQWYPRMGHFQSLKSTEEGSWRCVPPSHTHTHFQWCFTIFASSVLCNWSSSILCPIWSYFPGIFRSLQLKYFVCSFNPIVPIYSSLNYPVCSVSHTGVCAYLSC